MSRWRRRGARAHAVGSPPPSGWLRRVTAVSEREVEGTSRTAWSEHLRAELDVLTDGGGAELLARWDSRLPAPYREVIAPADAARDLLELEEVDGAGASGAPEMRIRFSPVDDQDGLVCLSAYSGPADLELLPPAARAREPRPLDRRRAALEPPGGRPALARLRRAAPAGRRQPPRPRRGRRSGRRRRAGPVDRPHRGRRPQPPRGPRRPRLVRCRPAAGHGPVPPSDRSSLHGRLRVRRAGGEPVHRPRPGGAVRGALRPRAATTPCGPPRCTSRSARRATPWSASTTTASCVGSSARSTPSSGPTDGTRPDGPLAFKLDSARVPDVPAPVPFREILVHGRNVLGHPPPGRPRRSWRLRWSDRPQDLRSEVLDLMRTQVLKNALIVPTGAKGGFVLNGPSAVDPTTRRDRAGRVRGVRRGAARPDRRPARRRGDPGARAPRRR